MPFPFAFSHPWYLLCLLALAPTIWLWWRGRNRYRRWREGASLALRAAIVLLVTLGLSGLQWVRASDAVAVVFLLDASDSIDGEAREQAVAFVRSALAEMGPDDQAALVLFGADALVERPMSHAGELGDLLSIPATAHTDVGQAVRLGLALLPATSQRRIVLLSDGRATVPGAETAARLAAAGGVEVGAVPLPARSGDEAWVDEVRVPNVLYEGETTTVLVRLESLVSQPALVRLYADDTLVAEQAVRLHPGTQTLSFDLPAGEPGFHTFTAQLVPRDDTFFQNNVMGAFALVKGAPGVLVVARDPYEDPESGQLVDDAGAVVEALTSAGLRVDRTPPARMPTDLAELGAYATTVLANVPAADLGPRRMELIQTVVRDLGRGLVCIGGAESYGVGGYYRTALEETLPVEMTIKDKERLPPLAIVFAVDKSGSMGTAAAQGGVIKIELAKEAVLRSLELLNPNDQVGVVAFDGAAHWVWSLSELEDPAAAQQQVATLRADGGTDIYAGLNAAVGALEGSDAQHRHVILLTDGGASQERLPDLVSRLRAAGGTLSTVGVGQDSAAFLQAMAVDGGGRYHYTDDPSTIPQIFAQETSLAQRAYIVEETFYPSLAGYSPALAGIAAVPALHGYVATSIKPMAQMVLASGWDDPVLAQWQYGLGRAVAWTSDAKGQWARAWLRWEQFPRFWAQAVRWTIVERDTSDLEVQVLDHGEEARIVVDVMPEEGVYGDNLEVNAYLLSPSLGGTALSLEQRAPGRYEGHLIPREAGVYLVRVDARASGEEAAALSQVTGYVRTYSPEYRLFGTDEAALRQIVAAGGGVLLSDPAAVFARQSGVPPVKAYTDVWPWLLLAAGVLLPLDVAVRRLVLSAREVHAAMREVRARMRPPAREAARSERLARLIDAKGRVAAERPPLTPSPQERREESSFGLAPGRSEGGAEKRVGASETVREMVEERTLAPDEQESVTARLLEAKRRARRGGQDDRG